MIIPGGYSKDPNIRPEGIVLTLPVQFFEERKAGIEPFKKAFERYMQREDALWNFCLTNLPTVDDIAWVYLIFDRHLQYQCNFVQYERNVSKSFTDAPDGRVRHFPGANWVIFTGPVVKPPEPYPLKGFQGFRYCTKLF